MTLIDNFKSFNRKERFILLHRALGFEGQSFRLGDGFRQELSACLSVTVPPDAFVAMDYHIDWLQMALHLTHKSLPKSRTIRNSDLVRGNQEDIDLLIAFEHGETTHVVMIEAKGGTAWSNKQLLSKAARLERMFRRGRPGTDTAVPHFVMMSPKKPHKIVVVQWPDWMKPDRGEPLWLELALPDGLMKPTRCTKDGTADKSGGYIRIDISSHRTPVDEEADDTSGHSPLPQFPGVTFHPWKGRHYGRESRFGVRLLVLGESHYGEEGDSEPTLTQDTVRYWAQERRYKFFTMIAKVLLGNPGWIDDEARAEVWEHVAFYNFVQSLLPAARTAPTFTEWCAAQVPFKTALAALQPDAVLVLGSGLWDHILYRPKNVEFGVVYHPSSSRMKYEESRATFQDLLSRARQRK